MDINLDGLFAEAQKIQSSDDLKSYVTKHNSDGKQLGTGGGETKKKKEFEMFAGRGTVADRGDDGRLSEQDLSRLDSKKMVAADFQMGGNNSSGNVEENEDAEGKRPESTEEPADEDEEKRPEDEQKDAQKDRAQKIRFAAERAEKAKSRTRATSRKRKVDDDESETTSAGIQLHNFPKSLLTMCRQILEKKGEGGNAMNCIAAFVYAMRDPTIDIDYSDVPREVKRMSKVIADNTNISVYDELKVVQHAIKNMTTALDEITLAQLYILFDRLALMDLTTAMPTNPSEVNFLQPGIDSMKRRLKSDAKALRDRINREDGRPMS